MREELLVDQLMQLPMDILPFAQAGWREEIAVARLPQAVLGQVVFQPMVERPKVEVGEKIRVGVGEALMGRVRFLLLVHGPFPRILHLERRGDDQQFLKAAMVGGGQQHPADPRIDRQSAELFAQRRELPALVDGGQFEQRVVAVADERRLWRVEEREFVDRAEPQRFGLKDHSGEVRAADFRLRVGLAAQVVVRAVQPYADARPQPAAAAFPLVGRRARNRLDRQPLDFAPRRVPADAGHARVDHVVNARHGQG